MMKNSTLLRWTNARNGRNHKNGNKNWIHPPEALQGGHIAYLVKFLGSTEVSQSKGIDVVKEAITRLRFSQQIKKTEGTKTPKVELTVSVDGVAIQPPKSKKVLFQYPLHQISYCADDKAEKRFFSFIAKEADRDVHVCFVFVSDKLAEEITLTIGQAFDLAYRRFLETSTREGDLRKQLTALRQQLQSAQQENNTLKERLAQVAALKDRPDLGHYMETNGISDLPLVNGTQSAVEPIIHQSPPNSQQEAPPAFKAPPIPPRSSIKSEVIEDHETSEDDFDFDPRAGEGGAPVVTNGGVKDVLGGSGTASPDSNDMTSDDDFDPRAEESHPREGSNESESRSSIFASTPLELSGISNFPTIVPPPRPNRQQDKVGQNYLLDGSTDPFSTPIPGGDLLTQFDQMEVGFSRGLSFGSANSDFTLESLDPLKN